MNHSPCIPVLGRTHRLRAAVAAVFLTGSATLGHAGNPPETDRFADHEKLVGETHVASLKLREENLRKTITRKNHTHTPLP
jgi:hypothetical protein